VTGGENPATARIILSPGITSEREIMDRGRTRDI
jgi:hypothetical protein